MDLVKLWKTVLAELELTVTRGAFSTFFAQTRLLELNKNVAKIGCISQYHCDLTEKRYYSLIKDILDRLTKQNNSLVFVPFPKEEKISSEDIGPLFTGSDEKEEEVDFAKKRVNLRPDFTFENFCVSSSNEVAYAAATAVARSPGDTYNPLFLYGGVGVGKTHLMQAIAHRIIEKNPKTKIIYCAGEDFTNEIIEAIRQKTTNRFREKYRKLDILLIDDVQFIAGKERVQEEFFHTFNSLQRSGGQVVLTSDKEPSEIKGLEDRLRSRFEGGLTVDIQPPDFELRTAILLTKAKQKKINLEIDIAKLIAANIESTRKLEGILIKVQAASLAKKQPITPDFVRLVLGQRQINNQESKKRNLTPKEILSCLSDYYSLKQGDIKGSCRKKSFSLPRQVLMYLLRTELNLPYIEIANFLEKRDHTTIIYGVEKIASLLTTSEKLREEVAAIKKRLYK